MLFARSFSAHQLMPSATNRQKRPTCLAVRALKAPHFKLIRIRTPSGEVPVDISNSKQIQQVLNVYKAGGGVLYNPEDGIVNSFERLTPGRVYDMLPPQSVQPAKAVTLILPGLPEFIVAKKAITERKLRGYMDSYDIRHFEPKDIPGGSEMIVSIEDMEDGGIYRGIPREARFDVRLKILENELRNRSQGLEDTASAALERVLKEECPSVKLTSLSKKLFKDAAGQDRIEFDAGFVAAYEDRSEFNFLDHKLTLGMDELRIVNSKSSETRTILGARSCPDLNELLASVTVIRPFVAADFVKADSIDARQAILRQAADFKITLLVPSGQRYVVAGELHAGSPLF